MGGAAVGTPCPTAAIPLGTVRAKTGSAGGGAGALRTKAPGLTPLGPVTSRRPGWGPGPCRQVDPCRLHGLPRDGRDTPNRHRDPADRVSRAWEEMPVVRARSGRKRRAPELSRSPLCLWCRPLPSARMGVSPVPLVDGRSGAEAGQPPGWSGSTGWRGRVSRRCVAQARDESRGRRRSVVAMTPSIVAEQPGRRERQEKA